MPRPDGRQLPGPGVFSANGVLKGSAGALQLPISAYPPGQGAPKYVIDDHFFQAAFGGSFLNHQFLEAPLSTRDATVADLRRAIHLADD